MFLFNFDYRLLLIDPFKCLLNSYNGNGRTLEEQFIARVACSFYHCSLKGCIKSVLTKLLSEFHQILIKIFEHPKQIIVSRVQILS